MNRNYGNNEERVEIRFDGKENDKWDLLIMVGEHGNKRENVGAGGNALEYKWKMWELIIL